MSYIKTMRAMMFSIIAILLLLGNTSYANITEQPQNYEGDREVTINFKGLKIADLIDITSKLLNRNIIMYISTSIR